MSVRHRHLVVPLVLTLCLLVPTTALAAGKTTPTPVPTAKLTATQPPATATAPAATATAVPATAVPATATAVPTSAPTLAPSVTDTGSATATDTTTSNTGGSASDTTAGTPPTAADTTASTPPTAADTTASTPPASADNNASTPPAAADTTAGAAPAASTTASSPPASADTSGAAPVAGVSPRPSPTPETLPDDTFTIWHGVVREGGAYRRSAPSSAGEILEDLDPGTPIRVDRWVAGSMLYPDVITWGQVDPEDGGGYIFGGALAGVLPPDVPPAPDAMQGYDGTWVDVNLTLNVVTAYQDGSAVKMMLTSPGRPGYETDTGNFAVRTRLLSQEMRGPGYDVPNVPHVQYFFGAEALHGRYWTLPGVLGQTEADVDDDGQIQVLDDAYAANAGDVNSGVAFGVPSSHGCLGLDLDSATWLYSISGIGTPVEVHY
ncbi:MAG: L,D-transpeptidase family protein [Chloroflexi bacterium]|nr:L,D-transpeptidase family protein [Chloroflexota bacterium]